MGRIRKSRDQRYEKLPTFVPNRRDVKGDPDDIIKLTLKHSIHKLVPYNPLNIYVTNPGVVPTEFTYL